MNELSRGEYCSGDTDSVVPVTATRFSLSHLKMKVKKPWYPWYSGGQVCTRLILISAQNYI